MTEESAADRSPPERTTTPERSAPERAASQTAVGVMLMRAAHQLFDATPRVLDDPVVLRLAEDGSMARVRDAREQYQSEQAMTLRAHVVVRSRVAEDRLHEAFERGVARYVVLGAGLDTFAWRQPAWSATMEIVEVDHPSSQRYKQHRLELAGIETPRNVRFAPVDFEHESLEEGLALSTHAAPSSASWR